MENDFSGMSKDYLINMLNCYNEILNILWEELCSAKSVKREKPASRYAEN